ncbi:MAG TPA: energy transducer TonB [Bryobacteraceae bacterium]|nr:energy transducer TonB [Bryobacteraceae bacterium]
MPARLDILDERESLRKPLLGSLTLHVAVAAAVIATPLITNLNKREPWGDLNSGGPGSMSVNVVNKIPLPGRAGQVNPLANDTESMVPAPPPAAKAQKKAPVAEPDAIPLPSKNAQKRPAPQSTSADKWRAQQRDLPNQMHNAAGPGLVSPMVGQTGSGGVGVGKGSPFGRRFGNYAAILRDSVARKWNTGDVDPRIRTAPPVIVLFTILRNGSIKNVRVVQRSPYPLLDSSAERAIYDAVPFPPLPAEYEGSEANIEFEFQLSR